MFIRKIRTTWLIALFVLQVSSLAHAGAFESYQLRPALSFSLPGSNSEGTSVMDALPDGRLVVVTTRATIFNPGPAELYLESAVGTRDFRYLGDLPLSTTDNIWYNPGAFIRVSPSAAGTKIAIGNSSYSVGVFDAASLIVPASAPSIGTAAPVSVTWHQPSSSAFLSSASWYNDQYLAIANAPFGGPANLYMLDTQTGNTKLVVAGPGSGASSGIAFDAANNLLYGNGYDYSANGETGELRRFDPSNWQSVAFGADPALAFTAGENLGEILSANSLAFDDEGNLLIGGGDSFGSDPTKKNFFAIADLLPDGTVGTIRQFDPDSGYNANSYSLTLNRATGEILAFDPFGSNPSQVFVVTIPEPTTTVLVLCAAAGLLIGKRRSLASVRRSQRS